MSLVIDKDFQSTVRRFLSARSPLEQNRQDAEKPGRPVSWDALAHELGLAGLLVPEGLGGQGAGVRELGAALVETSRSGWSGPLVACAGVGVHLLRAIDPEDRHDVQRSIAGGERVVVPLVHGPGLGADLRAGTPGLLDSTSGLVSVEGSFVDAGTHADGFLVPARDESGRTLLVLVDAQADATEVRVMASVDPGRGFADVAIDQAPCLVLGEAADLADHVDDALLLGALMTAAESIGLAERCLEVARDYAVTREQFGRPIATFQVIKHKLVDMYTGLETATSAVAGALDDLDAGASQWRLHASMAKAVTSDVVMEVAREATQVLGGIGFTWEHEIAHHFRRATTQRALYGTPVAHRRRIAKELGL